MKQFLSISILLIFAAHITHSQNEVHQWESVEFEFTAEDSINTPYITTLPDNGDPYMTAIFEGIRGEAQGERYVLSGFWDGGSTFKVRFAPPETGTWKYRTTSEDGGLDNQTGELVCVEWSEEEKRENPTRRGLIQVNQTGENAGRFFVYTDGTPFLWIGDTWWNWTKRGVPFERFKILADDRVEKGFTVGQLFFAGRGWGRSSSLLNAEYTEPDFKHLHHVETMIRYANSMGLTVWVHGWWGGPDIQDTIGAENIRRWCRYMVHRLSAYNVIWVLAGEYNLHNYGGFELDFWKDLGAMIDAEDPYKRAISVHPTPPGWGGGSEAPQWSTATVLHEQDWLDYNQSQVGHGKWRNEMIPLAVEEAYQTNPPKPIVVTEPWYEFIKGNPPAKDVRFGGWAAVLSGAAGHSYGGGHVWKAHVPEAPSGEDSWPMEMGFETNTLDYPGAQSISYMAKFLQHTKWWKLEPHPELVIDNPSNYCGAHLGEEYVVYLKWGGTVKIDLRDASSEDTFQCDWIDLTTEEVRKSRNIKGGHIELFYPPEDYPSISEPKDYLLYIHK